MTDTVVVEKPSAVIPQIDKTSVVAQVPNPVFVLSGVMGPPGVTKIGMATDVDTSTLTDGAILVYKSLTNMWTSTTQLNAQNIDAGEF